jgi:hypothetical protein
MWKKTKKNTIKTKQNSKLNKNYKNYSNKLIKCFQTLHNNNNIFLKLTNFKFNVFLNTVLNNLGKNTEMK